MKLPQSVFSTLPRIICKNKSVRSLTFGHYAVKSMKKCKMSFTLSQRVFIVGCYFETKSFKTVQNKFLVEFPEAENLPNKSTINSQNSEAVEGDG